MNSLPDIDNVLSFLHCRTPAAWVQLAISELPALLSDHASLELKAAQQAQKLIRRYGSCREGRSPVLSASLRGQLVHKMSRLAREELRHFEQVVSLIEQRGESYTTLSPSRYAAGLHELARSGEPDALVDALIIGAVIEARSCERFFSLVSAPRGLDGPTARFYKSLLRSEARHFEDYLALARAVESGDVEERVGVYLERDAELVLSDDLHLRFHSGIPKGSDAAASVSYRHAREELMSSVD